MSTKYSFAVGLICLSLFASCKKEPTALENVSVPKDITEAAFGELVSSIKITPLANDAGQNLGQVVDLYCIDKGYILVDKQNGVIYEYSKSGGFICQIGRKGKGPGEYLHIINVQCLKDKFIVFSSPNEILSYDYEGKFIGQEKASADLGLESRYVGDALLTYYGYRPDKSFRLALVENGVEKESYLETRKRVMAMTGSGSILSPSPRGIDVLDTYSNLIYRYKDSSLTPVLAFDFGEYAIDKAFFDYDDVFAGAQFLLSSPFATINRFLDEGNSRLVEIYHQKPTGIGIIYGLERNGDWSWFSAGAPGIAPFAGSFRVLTKNSILCLVDASLWSSLPAALSEKIANKEALGRIDDNSNYVIAEIVFK